MSFYDQTKEDVRPWRGTQDTQGQSQDDAALTSATALSTRTTSMAQESGVIVTPKASTGAAASTVQLTATPISTPAGTVTWTSSNPAIATVNSTGLVTRVATGKANITASYKGSGAKANPAITGYSVITVS